MKLFNRKPMLWTVAVFLILIVGGGVGSFVFSVAYAHLHCIKQTGLTLRVYSGDHNDRYPYSTNGFGDAIVLLLRVSGGSPAEARLFTAPGDDGSLLLECLKTGAPMPAGRCTRAYVQGLTETNNPMIAMVFDRYPTRGGDHGRSPWGPLLREVWMAGGSMRVIREEDWPEFRAKQIELLVAEGISRTEAERLHAPFKR